MYIFIIVSKIFRRLSIISRSGRLQPKRIQSLAEGKVKGEGCCQSTRPPEYQYLTLSVFLLTEAGRRLGLEDGSVTVFV